VKVFNLSFRKIILILLSFFIFQSFLVFGFIEFTERIAYFQYVSFGIFLPLFYLTVRDYQKFTRKHKDLNFYTAKLTNTLISQSHNTLFYSGDLTGGAKELTREVCESLNADRCSVWLYNEEKTAIECQQLYLMNTKTWENMGNLYRSDFENYFLSLENNPIVIASDAEKHTATACFLDQYLKPLGIKSLLDVPILYKGNTIGVICVESLTKRDWLEVEVNFARSISSLYAFAYSVAETNELSNDLLELQKFVDYTALVSKTDSTGKITYVNKKFTEVSGWKLDEVLGKTHNVLSSGKHPKTFWVNMYKKVVQDKEIWNKLVTNKTRDGKLYYVDTFVKGDFDSETQQLKGFTSIRQDMTEIIETLNELDKKNTYLEHAAKILRHDMHSGINTYIPRGIKSLERRLDKKIIKELKLEAPLKMLKEGLKHTQKVYTGVYEFTNLVKKDSVLEKTIVDVREILDNYLTSTAYRGNVLLNENLPQIMANESLFCTAIDNLIRNGLKYNDSDSKYVKIFLENDFIIVQDNGRGMTQREFEQFSKPYARKRGQKEAGSGLGLNICVAILEEHDLEITAEKVATGGTRMKIKIS